MATTRLMPLHTGKGCTIGQTISDILDYSKIRKRRIKDGSLRAGNVTQNRGCRVPFY